VVVAYRWVTAYLQQHNKNTNQSPIDYDSLLGKLVGEPERVMRVLSVLTAANLENAETFDSLIRERQDLHVTKFLDYGVGRWDSSWLVDSTPSIRYLYLQPPYNVIARRLAWIRAARLVVALHWWRADHGHYPQTLDPLVRDYIQEIPADPISGERVRYFPKGFSIDLPMRGFSDESPSRAYWGQPFVWAMGLHLRRQFLGGGAYSSDYETASIRWNESKGNYDVEWYGASEFDALQKGMTFTLEPAEPTNH
jgi:hypothetical protein